MSLSFCSSVPKTLRLTVKRELCRIWTRLTVAHYRIIGPTFTRRHNTSEQGDGRAAELFPTLTKGGTDHHPVLLYIRVPIMSDLVSSERGSVGPVLFDSIFFLLP